MEGRKRLAAGQMDFPLFIAVVLLCAFGIVMLFSASYYYAQDKFSDGYYYLRSQLMYLGIGLVVMYVISRIGYDKWEKLKVVALIATLILMAAVVIMGENRNGATRWLVIFGVSFQPSELAKFALVLYMSAFMSSFQARMKSFTRGVVPMLIIMAAFALLLLLQKNLSMLVILMITGIIMLFVGGARMKHLLLMGAVCVVLVVLAVNLEEYRVSRMKIFLDPWNKEYGDGYQLRQSLYALGSGGLFGKGLNFSKQKLLFLPYGESDFIFSIIGEELGFLGCLCVIAAYVFIAYRGFRVAIRCKDRFGSMMAAGITSVISTQAAVNIGVATSSIPTTGQTLPFVSAGGTSLIIFLAATGILLNISRNIAVE